MEPTSYIRSVVDRNVVMRRMTVLNSISVLHGVGKVTVYRDGIWQRKTCCTVRTWPGHAAHLHLVLRSKMSGAIPPFPYPPSR